MTIKAMTHPETLSDEIVILIKIHNANTLVGKIKNHRPKTGRTVDVLDGKASAKRKKPRHKKQ